MKWKMRNIYCFLQEWEEYDTHLIVCVESGRIVGSVCVSNYFNDNESWIHSLYVDKNFRRQGIAKQLLNKADGKATCVQKYVGLEPECPSWLSEYYKKRGYKIGNI